MTTRADRELQDARECVTKAAASISAIVMDDCDGWDDYSFEFRQQLEQAYKALIEIRGLLRP